MRRLLREPVTLGLVALCIGWTVVSRSLHLTAFQAGALSGIRLWEGEYWRLFSATLLHHLGSWIHLVLNAISLFFVGRLIERECGWRVLLGWVVGAALASFAVSLIAKPDPRIALMGISGAVFGLVGLLLAIEWASTKRLLEFLTQRNTLVILFFLLLGFPIAVLAERWMPGVKVDHAGHAGGFFLGLLAGLFYYTRGGIRALRGTVVGIVLAIVPTAYAAHPFLDPQYHLWLGKRAYHARDFETAARELERAHELDPDSPGMREELLEAYLLLAADRLGSPDGSAFVAKAYALGGRSPGPWERFAVAAEAQQRPDEAYLAWREAATLLPDSRAWRAHVHALRLLRARGTVSPREAVEVARGAVFGLRAELQPENRDTLERAIAEAADVAGAAATAAGEEQEVAGALEALFRILAENAGEDARRPGYRLRSAQWLSRSPGARQEDVAARFGATITEAALYGDPRAGEAAARWFREHGMPVPEPDLEGEGDGG